MARRVNSSDDVCAQDTSPMLPEGITKVHLKLLVFNSFGISFYSLGTACWFWIIVQFLGFFSLSSHRSVGKVFCTMDGHGSMIHIHPSSSVNAFSKRRTQYETFLLLLHLWSHSPVAPSCLTTRASWTGSSSTMCWWPQRYTSGPRVLFDTSGWRTCYPNYTRWTSMSWAVWQEKKWRMRRWRNGRPGKQPKDNQVSRVHYL